MDIRVAPDGVDKREIAKVLYDEFMETNPTLWIGPSPPKRKRKKRKFDDYDDEVEFEVVVREEE